MSDRVLDSLDAVNSLDSLDSLDNLDVLNTLLDLLETRVRNTAPMILPLLVNDLPNEGIGFVWAQGISHVRNQAQSPTRFSFSPTRLEELIVEHDNEYPQFMYHSHPRGEANLSTDDWRNLRHNWHSESFPVPWVVFPMRPNRANYSDWEYGKVTGAKVGIYTPNLYRTIIL